MRSRCLWYISFHPNQNINIATTSPILIPTQPNTLYTSFLATHRNSLSQCMSGMGVESITGNQKTKAVFILQAPEGAGENRVLTFFPLTICLALSVIGLNCSVSVDLLFDSLCVPFDSLCLSFD